MFGGLPRYATSKRTTLPWAVDIPSHWQIKRSKSIMRALDVRSIAGEEELLTVSSSRGVVPRASAQVSMFRAESYAGHKLCWPNDLVINSLWAWGRGLGVARHHGIVSTAYGVYRQFDEALDSNYLHQLVRSEPFQWELRVRSQGVWKSRLQITDDRWLDAPLLVPPLEEQAAIVRYLAHANARINKAIAAKRRLITLLEEQAKVRRAEMLDSLGASQRLATVIWEGPTNGTSPEISEQGDLETFSISVVRDGTVDIRQTDIKFVDRVMVRDIDKYELRAHDVLMVRGNGNIGLVGRTALVLADMPGRIYPDLLMRIRFRSGVDPRFMVAALNSPSVREQIENRARTAVGTYKLSGADVRALRVPVPALSVQQELIHVLSMIASESSRAIGSLAAEIALLQEFRTRLVADVVTGQVDVRAIAATLPDAPEATAELAADSDDEFGDVREEGL